MTIQLIASLAWGSLGAVALVLRWRDRRVASRAARIRRACGVA